MIKVRIPIYAYTNELVEKEKEIMISNPDYVVPINERILIEMTFYSINAVSPDEENGLTEIHSNGRLFYTNLSQEEVEKRIDQSMACSFINSKS